MDYIWIFIIVTTVVFGVILALQIESSSDVLGLIFGAPFFGCIVGGLLFLVVASVKTSHIAKTEEVVMHSNPIVALETSDQTEGEYSFAFFVGSGYIGETKYYAYYKQLQDGDIIFEKVRADQTRINFSDEPKIVVYGKTYNYEEVKDNKWFSEEQRRSIDETKTVIYVPEGTMKSNYKIN